MYNATSIFTSHDVAAGCHFAELLATVGRAVYDHPHRRVVLAFFGTDSPVSLAAKANAYSVFLISPSAIHAYPRLRCRETGTPTL